MAAELIIATGTSGLDLNRLAASLIRPERFLGIHYFMPADTSPVVEVMSGPQTPAVLVDRVADAVEASGKDALRLYRPTIGYVVNRLQHAILHEAYYRIEAGVTSAAEIDRAAHSCRWTQPQSRHPGVAGAARNDAHRRRQRHGPSRHDARCAPRPRESARCRRRLGRNAPTAPTDRVYFAHSAVWAPFVVVGEAASGSARCATHT